MSTNQTAVVEAKPQAVEKAPTSVKGWLESPAFQEQIAKALPSHLTSDRMIRVALTALIKTPKLKDCTVESVCKSLLDCSSIGLEPDGRQAHLIPYGTVCTLIVDYKGLVALAMRSGQVSMIHADKVCENDEFVYDKGALIAHKIDFRKPRGNAYAYYSLVRMKDGTESCQVMTLEDVKAIQKRSKSGSSGPWVTDFDEMSKKTVFKRHSKWLPLSAEFRDAIAKDDEHETKQAQVTSVTTAKPVFKVPELQSAPTKADELAALLAENDLTFEDFQTLAIAQGWLKEEYPSISDVPKAVLTMVLKNPADLIAAIKGEDK